MLNLPSKLMFSLTLISGSIMTLSSNSWIGAWMGMEINLLSFIPLISNLNNPISNEMTMKYFLIQTIASLIFLFSSLFMIKNNLVFNNNTQTTENMLVNAALIMKLGASPFHMWFIEMMTKISWSQAFVLMTWQKIAPLSIMNYCQISWFTMIIAPLSLIIGSIQALNQTHTKKIMAFSSVAHLGWMLTASLINTSLIILYLMIYIMISAPLIMIFNKMKISNLNQIYSSKTSKTTKLLFTLNLISLAGLPPFLGFMPKWMLLETLMIQNKWMAFIMIMLALITMFFYIRIAFSSIMISYPTMKWNKSIKSSNLTGLLLMNSALTMLILNILYL